MRKRIIQRDTQGTSPDDEQDWLDVEDLVQVELTSEDAEYPKWVAREAYTPSRVGCDSAMIRYIESRAWLGKTESQGNSIVASCDPGVSH